MIASIEVGLLEPFMIVSHYASYCAAKKMTIIDASGDLVIRDESHGSTPNEAIVLWKNRF